MSQITWAHFNPVRIHAGVGSLSQLLEWVPVSGPILLVTTQGFVKRGVVDRVIRILGAERVVLYPEVTPNPDLDDLDRATARFVSHNISAVVALGGGSVLDAAKVLSVTLVCGFDVPLQRVLREQSGYDWQNNLPVITIPTTSGTGAEVTPFATVWDGANNKKYSVAGSRVFPCVALLDPELTISMPEDETLFSALDAISHSLESLWNKNSTPISEAIAIRALTLANTALPRVLTHQGNIDMRAQMQQASVLSGLAISQTRTAIAHSISYPLTSHYGVPHGLACSFSLTNVITLYVEQHPESPFKALMLETHQLLADLDLFTRLGAYTQPDQVRALQSEMLTPGRADNFDGAILSIERLILQSNQK